MSDRVALGPLGRRQLGALLLTAGLVWVVLLVGSVVPHLMARVGHSEAVDVGWLIAAAVLAGAVAVSVAVAVTRRMVAPVNAAIATAQLFAAGDHSVRATDFGRSELTDLTDALNAAAAEVERSERSRRQLTADIAHELRTPLTALQAGLEELRDGLVEPDSATLASLHDQATRLGRIVNDLSELSEAESAGLELRLDHVDLGREIALAVAAREGTLTSAGLEVVLDLAPGVVALADVDRLHQVVGNLLANTALYCRAGDQVRVSVREGGGGALVEVADTGPGFDPADLAHAFDRMWRGRSARGTAGSGLGLAIVRALVLAQGGTVELTCGAEGGALVRVWLPLASGGIRPPAGRASEEAPLA